jgi:O-antigen ligase
MASITTTLRLPEARLAQVADGLAIAVAASLPWSTSATSIFVGLWLIALLPTLDLAGLRRETATPAGGLPVLLVAFAALGVLWTEVSWTSAFAGLTPFLKLLLIPLLFFHFRRSERGTEVLTAFLVSCAVLLLVSLIFAVWKKPFGLTGNTYGVPVKDRIAQSGEFVMCAFIAIYLAIDFFRAGRRAAALGLSLLAAAFLFNLLYVTTSRTALVVIPVLLVLLAFRLFGWKTGLAIVATGAVVGVAVWASSPNLRQRVLVLAQDVEAYSADRTSNSAGQRLDFWKKSVDFIAAAPVIGQGTGSIKHMFEKAVAGETGDWSKASANPHNQTLAVGIQLGLVGVAVLFAMWLAHLWLFRSPGLIAWVGLVVVAQNIISSLFNSHLFDFTQGWTYVFGVGVAGGMVLRGRLGLPSGASAQRPL